MTLGFRDGLIEIDGELLIITLGSADSEGRREELRLGIVLIEGRLEGIDDGCWDKLGPFVGVNDGLDE